MAHAPAPVTHRNRSGSKNDVDRPNGWAEIFILEPKSAKQHLGHDLAEIGRRGEGGFEPATARNREPRPRPLGHGGSFPLGNRPPGESPPRGITPWGIIPQGNHPPGESPPGESSPWESSPGESPPGESPPGESPPWGSILLGNHSPGESPPKGITPLGEGGGRLLWSSVLEAPPH